MKNYILFCFLNVAILYGLAAQDFINPLFIPEYIPSSNPDVILDVVNSSHNFNPNGSDYLNTIVPTVAVKQINGNDVPILGPTVAGQYKKTLNRDIFNGLAENTTFHWHGAHAAPDILGGPHHILQPGDIWKHPFEVIDGPSTMWYHPLDVGSTYRQTQMGFAGMVYFEDREGEDNQFSSIHQIFPNEYGVDDFPIILQTKKFDNNNGVVTINTDEEYTEGYEYLVNATANPYLEVGADMVRLRLLNADAKFSFLLQVVDSYGNAFPYHIIATDAGYTTESFTSTRLLVSPGERYEILLDLRGLTDNKYIIKTVEGDTQYEKAANQTNPEDLLELRVGNSGNSSPIISFPISLLPSERPELSEIVEERIIEINQTLQEFDQQNFDLNVVNHIVTAGAVEYWHIDNASAEPVPFHLQGNHFWLEDDFNTPSGDKIEPPEWVKNGPKDQVLIPPGYTADIIIRFSHYNGEISPAKSYAFHSNNLHHLDDGLMNQYVVWDGVSTATIDKDQSTRDITVFPNPAQEEIFIKGESSEESTVKIYNIQGRLLKDFSLPAFDVGYRLNINDLSSGMLIVEWYSTEGKAVSRVMKK